MLTQRKVWRPTHKFLSACAAIGILVHVNPAYAQGQDLGQGVKLLEPVEVIGTRVKRTDWETPTPIQVITADEIRSSGATSTTDVLRQISASSSGGLQDLTLGGFAMGTATVSLRGLGSHATLVLLNGRRITATPFHDPSPGQSTLYNLNAIPLAAIERIEILKSGASAIYGSDAMAGVINIILRQNYRGAEAGINYSQSAGGEFGNRDAYGFVGFGDPAEEKLNGYLVFNNVKRNKTRLVNTRGVEESELSRLFFRNTATSTISYPGNLFRESTPGNDAFTTFVGADARCPPDRLLASGRCGFNADEVFNTVAPQDSNSVYARMNLGIRPGLSLFSELGFSRVEATMNAPIRGVLESGSIWFAQDGRRNLFRFILPAGHPDNPTTVPVALRYRFADIGDTNRTVATDTSRLLFGARGTHAGWDWESAFLYMRIERENNDRGLLHYPSLVDAINTQAYRPFGNNSPATLARISPTIHESGKASNTSVDLKGTRQLTELAGGPLVLATGAELRKEELSVIPDPRIVNGEFINVGTGTASGKRNISSIFGELSAPFVKRVETQLALRFDRYSDFGSSTTPQLGIKWKPIETLALRATYAEGFRAPSLSTIGNSTINGGALGMRDPVRCGATGGSPDDCNFSVGILTRGNPDLKPEKSTSQTIGLVFAPSADVGVAVDYYRIRRTNEVGTLSAQFLVNNEARFPGTISRNPNPATWLPGVPNSGPIQSLFQPFFNLGHTVTSGIDLDASLRNSLGAWGRMTTTFSATYLLKFTNKVRAGEPLVDYQGAFGPIGELPRFKGSIASTWAYHDYAVTARVNHVSGWFFGNETSGCFNPDPAYRAATGCRVKPWTTLDLALRYSGVKNLDVGFGVRNALDKPAPLDPNNTLFGFNPGFHNPYGRYFNVWLNYKFL